MNQLVFISKYLKYKFFARHRYAHGIHSPFLFNFINNVLLNTVESDDLIKLNETGRITANNPGFRYIDSCSISGNFSATQKNSQKDIRIVWTVRGKFSNFLLNLYAFVNPELIIEIGNCRGISAFSLSLPLDEKAKYIIEENKLIQKSAEDFSKKMTLPGFYYLEGNQADRIEILDSKLNGNIMAIYHLDPENAALPEYFYSLVNKCSAHSVIVCSGIHHSGLSEKQWKIIQQIDNVRLTIDLFYLGIVFFKEELQKENYVIKF